MGLGEGHAYSCYFNIIILPPTRVPMRTNHNNSAFTNIHSTKSCHAEWYKGRFYISVRYECITNNIMRSLLLGYFLNEREILCTKVAMGFSEPECISNSGIWIFWTLSYPVPLYKRFHAWRIVWISRASKMNFGCIYHNAHYTVDKDQIIMQNWNHKELAHDEWTPTCAGHMRWILNQKNHWFRAIVSN